MQLIHRKNGLAPITAWLLIIATGFGLLHHGDHILRVDHSGWPFRPDVTPFTYSLFAYPVLLFALLGPARYFWLRWAGLAIGTAFTIFAHSRLKRRRCSISCGPMIEVWNRDCGTSIIFAARNRALWVGLP
jgi:hypothetical protein